MQIKWFKDKDDSLWFHDFEDKTIYVIFDTRLEKEGWFVGVYKNVQTIKNGKDLKWDKPSFYDGFTLLQAKVLVTNMVGGTDGEKDKKIKHIGPVKRNSTKRIKH